jgi:hypothetical protein
MHAVPANITRGALSGIQSNDEADLTMYALLSDVNSIAIDASDTHTPMR